MTEQRRYPGKIDRLPRAMQDLVGRLLAEGWTKTKITEALNAELAKAGEEPVSRHSVNRYTARMLAEGQDMREAHEAAKGWAQSMGQVDGGEVDAYLVEVARKLMLDHLHVVTDRDEGPKLTEISQLALAIRRLADTRQLADKRIERRLAAAADEVASVAKKQGLGTDTVAALRAALASTA